jgi:hypothetical protein
MGSVSAVMMMNSQIPRLRVYDEERKRLARGGERKFKGNVRTNLGSLVSSLLELINVRARSSSISVHSLNGKKSESD